jgi:integral membrane protein (TIGR01906 family)
MFADRPRQEIGSLRVFLIGVFILLVPVALITTTIRVAISEKAVYDYAVENYGAERASGIPEAELLKANQEIRDYLAEPDAGPLAPQVTNDAGETESLFNARETAHMADVRSLVQLMFTVQVIAAAAVITLIVAIAVLFPVRVLAAAALYGSLLTVALLGLAGMGAMAGFDAFWDQFHGIAFTNDLWQLDPDTDHLIQMYPEAFWQDAVTMLGGLITIQALALGIVSGLYLVLTRPRESVAPPPEPRALPQREREMRHRLSPPNPRHYVR